MEYKLEALDFETIQNILKEIIDSNDCSVTITLTNGNQLFGDILFYRGFFDKKPGKDWYAVKKDESGFFAVKLDPKFLSFNTKEGDEGGKSYNIKLKSDLISDIKPLNWEHTVKPLKNIPNPLAGVICKNNLQVAQNNDLRVKLYREYTLFPLNELHFGCFDEINYHGIYFEQDEMIYADWDFISLLSGGNKASVGALAVKFEPGRTVYQTATDKIKNGNIVKIWEYFSGKRIMGECRLFGHISIPEPEITTKIEGEDCILAICSEKQFFNPDNNYIPVILKKNSLSYPLEFLPYIRSKVVFYGEIKQIPIKEQGISSRVMLMARVIGYLRSSAEEDKQAEIEKLFNLDDLKDIDIVMPDIKDTIVKPKDKKNKES